MVQKAKMFRFSSYGFDAASRKAHFVYIVELQNNQRIEFQEMLHFPEPFPANKPISPELLDLCLYNLHLILGISYWKLHCAPIIEISTRPLAQTQAEFWNTVYTKGLGEFFYKNNIDFRGFVNFPHTSISTPPVESIALSDRSLVGIGGGKDSIVAIEELKKKGQQIAGFILQGGYESDIAAQITTLAEISTMVVNRQLDPRLFELNKSGDVYNGHIPISAVYAFVGILASLLYDHKFIVVANERSANVGNIVYLDQEINHQWSKSEEFERLFQLYIHTYITPSVEYYSIFRNRTELSIVKEFSQYRKYFPVFSSCNRNFAMTKQSVLKWCGECPKCAFVFAALAAYVPKIEVLDIFRKDLFNDTTLVPLFRQLAGLADMKPFECVGTFEETKEALYASYQKKEFLHEPVMSMFEQEILPSLSF